MIVSCKNTGKSERYSDAVTPVQISKTGIIKTIFTKILLTTKFISYPPYPIIQQFAPDHYPI